MKGLFVIIVIAELNQLEDCASFSFVFVLPRLVDNNRTIMVLNIYIL